MLSARLRLTDRSNATIDDVDRAVFDCLRFLDKEMASHPELVDDVDLAQLKRIGRLVSGVTTI